MPSHLGNYMGVGEGSVMFVATILLGGVTAIGAAVVHVAVVLLILVVKVGCVPSSSPGQRGGIAAPRTGSHGQKYTEVRQIKQKHFGIRFFRPDGSIRPQTPHALVRP